MSTSVNTGRYRADRSDNDGRRWGEQESSIPRENTAEGRLNQAKENIEADALFGFHRVTDVKERTGFLINMHTTDIVEDDKQLVGGVDYYFLEEDCSRFKISLPYNPYFYIFCRTGSFREVTTFLLKKYNGVILRVDTVEKEDLDLPNHLAGLQQEYLKLSFLNTVNMTKVRRDLMGAIKINKEREKSNTYYSKLLAETLNPNKEVQRNKIIDHLDNILDIREHDVPLHIRVSIDKGIFVGKWYSVKTRGSTQAPIITPVNIVEPPEPIVLAYDIETTKLPLKFPDATSDQIMMISYMLDGQGYLITNREIISADVDDFEYTPKPELEGFFTIFNEPNEKATIRRFFDHIKEVKPHVFVTYNGDFFDWPFVETRAAVHGMDMKRHIGFSKNKDGVYASRAAMHMDCLCWVKRDSYLPVGSQGLKAVAKAKLRYDPVELDPEDMCRLAIEEPATLANYSVSDAVATYYLYMKYVHPFIFALCTIIPMEPDEVLRKGSGTLCESLLMVEAYRANVIYPNKQEAELNKQTTDGHVLDQETYVGGHVEALESGVFRADIPYRFKIVPSAVTELIAGVENAVRHALEEEEKIPLGMVTNFDEVVEELKGKLEALRAQPLRMEKPVIYHLDVGAMYPNIILTNRLQPYAMVNETICASCDFNKPGALCQREMNWQWRGEVMAATVGEYQRIQQQLETEKFPPIFPGGPRRAFHELSKQDQAAFEKKRLLEYSRRAYKKAKMTRTEVRSQTICERENSFYVDTVRAFRDRRYEYKGLTKLAKQQVAAAIADNDAAAIKSAKSREVLYDSLQLAHKCILNSFYGYVMRKGSRWFSMEMGGIVCHTGAEIITKAREIIENVGRPLELDTDGIWCILPGSFPDNVIVHTTHPKKSKLVVSYPNAILNYMVKSCFTNDVYHEFDGKTYSVRSENSIFFEVDGPYLAMVLPSAKEEGKKLKKRYAVFNFDGSLAELKGFEVKRRGELRLIKIFQSSVFEAFLKGSTLEECYASVAKVANYWVDVLYSKGANIPDDELFDLISENKSMSKKLDEYGAQKSTSISTAKRLAEFLGDEMVKDAGLACKYIISKLPQGAPVTERAIPLAIFQSEPSVAKHFLRKWLKDPSINDLDIRNILDWSYYLERLGSTIQKIITIPAALQGVANPVPRIQHPDWLHKKILANSGKNQQRLISEIFSKVEKRPLTPFVGDIEDTIPNSPGFAGAAAVKGLVTPTVTKRKRAFSEDEQQEKSAETIINQNWRQVLGNPPPLGESQEELRAWIMFQKEKWKHQAKQRQHRQKDTGRAKRSKTNPVNQPSAFGGSLGGFFQRARQKLLERPWQIIRLSETNEPGLFRMWVLIDQELHQFRLTVPRVFYVNSRKARSEEDENAFFWRKCNKILPRSRPVYNLYRYCVPESRFISSGGFLGDLNTPDIEGIYESQMSLEFRAIMQLGCVCAIDKKAIDSIKEGTDTFHLDTLVFKSIAAQPYLQQGNGMQYIFLFHHWSSSNNHRRAIWSLFLSAKKTCHVFVLDTVKTNRMPNLNSLYITERNAVLDNVFVENDTPDAIQFQVQLETDIYQVMKRLQAALKTFKSESRAPTILAVQSPMDVATLTTEMPYLNEFPVVSTNVQDVDDLLDTFEWQRVGSKAMIRHYFNCTQVMELLTQQARYFHAPIGNIPADSTVFGADLFYARHLQKNNFVLWWSKTDKPDFGGSENDDSRLLTDFDETVGCTINKAQTLSNICIELNVESLAIDALLQFHRINDIDGTSSFVAFHNAPQATLQDIVTGDAGSAGIPYYDETALCSGAFRVLRNMIGAWMKDVTTYKNDFADMQLIHFYRWLRLPTSFMYDPALRRTLHGYTKKLFVQLVAELQRLGSIIVFADFNKIIVCTKKKTVKDAVGYIQYIVHSIQNKELFHSINITFRDCWRFLIWQDNANFAGVKGKLPLNLIEGNESEEMTEEEEEEPEISMNWNLMEYLPVEASCQASFEKVIAGYIHAIYMQLQKSEDITEFAKNLISNTISQKLFFIVQSIHKKLPEKVLSIKEHSHLDLGGKATKTISPALELSKAICQILSLSPGLDDEVFQLKKNLLKIIGVGCFSDKADWKDPCVSFVLPDVTCPTCNHTRDIDLCKDFYRAFEENRHVWKCPICKSSYDNDEIEFLLVDILNRKSMGYVLQDLQCKKCREVKRDNLNILCTCSGNFKTLTSRLEMITLVQIFGSIATKYEMLLLTDSLKCTKLLSTA